MFDCFDVLIVGFLLFFFCDFQVGFVDLVKKLWYWKGLSFVFREKGIVFIGNALLDLLI
jgi:hypothetical protein